MYNFTMLLSDLYYWVQPWITRIIVAVIIVIIGLIASQIARRFLKNALKEVELNKIFKKATGVKLNVEVFISDFAFYFIIFLSLVFAIEFLGWASVMLYILLAFVIIIVGVSIILGIKDLFPNTIAGIIIYKKRFIQKGDHIKVKNVEGEVVSLSLLEIKLRTSSGDEIIIPNTLITKNEVTRFKKNN